MISSGSQRTVSGKSAAHEDQAGGEDHQSEAFGHQAGADDIDRQRLHRKAQLLDEVAIFHEDRWRASHGFAESQPGEHAGEEIEHVVGGLVARR